MGHTWQSERDAFSDWTQFPRGRKTINNLSTTPQTLFAAGTGVKLTHFHVSSSDQINPVFRRITFRGVGGGAIILIVTIEFGEGSTYPGWQTDEAGVEVLTDNALTDVFITAFTVEPTIS